MRIGIDIRSLSAGRDSGVSEYIYNLLSAMFQIAKEEEFILFYNSFRRPLPQEVKNWTSLSNVEIIDYHLPSKLLNLSLWALNFPHLDRLINNLDVLFFPNITFSSVSRKTPYVLTFHDLSFELFPNFFNPYRRIWHFLINPRKKAEQAAKIITVSQSTAEDIKELYKVSGKKIYPILLGLSPLFKNIVDSKPVRKLIEERYQLPRGPFILYLGTIEPRKNIPNLIKAFNLFKKRVGSPHSLVIAGAIGWSYGKVFSETESSPYQKNVFFPGPIKNEDRPALYKMADLFVFPSFFEGFGLPPLEAMAAGTPVICSANTSLLEIFGNHALIINPYDSGELAWAMEQAINDRALSQSLRNKGKKFAQKFSWEKAARETLAVLHEATKDN